MKVAITSIGKELSAPVDPRFGRAQYIILFDTETENIELLDNSDNKNVSKGAGIQTATMISNAGAEVLITGYCGPKGYKVLETAGVRVVNSMQGSVQQAMEAFKNGEISYSDGPNAEAQCQK